MVKYLSALRHAAFVVGNSSSGMIEAPSFGIPTINVGIRQQGGLLQTSLGHQHRNQCRRCAQRRQPSFVHKIFLSFVAALSTPMGTVHAARKMLAALPTFFFEHC
jgi:hypothetical protein